MQGKGNQTTIKSKCSHPEYEKVFDEKQKDKLRCRGCAREKKRIKQGYKGVKQEYSKKIMNDKGELVLKCYGCKEYKEETEFYKDITRPSRNYRNSMCKQCQAANMHKHTIKGKFEVLYKKLNNLSQNGSETITVSKQLIEDLKFVIACYIS